MTKKILLIGLPLLLIGGAAYVYFFILKKSYAHFKLIPSSSYVVVTADLKSLAEKANVKKWEELYVSKKMNESAKPDAENGRFLKDVFSNPLSMGIDPLSDLYFFFQYSDQFQPSFGVAFAVRSTKDMETVLMKIPESNLDVKKEVIEKDGYKIFRVSKQALVAWKDGAGILAGGLDNDELDKWVDKIMNQDKSASLADNKYFIEFTQKDQDLGVFINYAGIYGSSVGGMAAASAQNNSYVNSYKTAYATMSVLFDNDQISVKNNYYNSDDDALAKYSFLTDAKVSEAALKSLTAKTPLVYYGFTFDLKKVLELIESDKNIDKMYTETAESLGMTKDEVKKILVGEIAASLNDFTMQTLERKHYSWDEKTDAMSETMGIDTVLVPEFSVAIGISDKAALQKLMDKTKLPKDSLGYYSVPLGDYTYYFVQTNAGVTITNSKAEAAVLTSKKEFPSVIGGKAGELAKASSAAFYWNLNLNDYPECLKTSMKKELKEDNYKMFADFMSMFTFMDATMTSTIGDSHVYMSKSDENSLWRIIKQCDGLAKKNDEDVAKEKALYEKEMQSALDSAATAPVVEVK